MNAILDDTHNHDGIAPVPVEERRLGGLEVGVLWGDLGIGLLVLVAGSLLVPSLGLRVALLASLVGSIIGSAMLAVVGRVGSDTGVPTMVALRPALGIRGSYLASVLNVGQLIGWAGLEIIIMSQAAEAISNEYAGFGGYYLWLAAFAVIGTVLAVGGPIVVVRQFLQRFGVWIVVVATLWLTYRLFNTYSVQDLFNDKGAGGFPNFWQGVDIAVSLPVSWLPLVADYSRYARRTGDAAAATSKMRLLLMRVHRGLKFQVEGQPRIIGFENQAMTPQALKDFNAQWADRGRQRMRSQSSRGAEVVLFSRE